MKNRLVQTHIDILRLLYKKSIGVNDIIKQTSSDRSYVIEVLRELAKNNLIIEEKDSRHKQKKIKKLAPLGEQFVQLIISIEQYTTSYYDLRKTVMENITVEESDKNVLINKLRGRGFAKEDIDRYQFHVIDSYWFLFNSYINMISALTIRNATILSEFKVKETAKNILNKIISDAISHQILVMLEYIDNARIKSKSNVTPSTVLYYLPSPVDFASVLSGSLVHNNKFIDKEAKEVLLSIFSTLNLPTNYIEEELERLKLILKKSRGDKHDYDTIEDEKMANKLKAIIEEESKRDTLVNMNILKTQISLYEELLRKSI